MDDPRFEEFKRAFASAEGRASYGMTGYSQTHAEALILNYERRTNTDLVGIFNQLGARQRAAASEQRLKVTELRQRSSRRLSLFLVAIGIAACIAGASAAQNHTETVRLGCVSVQHLGEQQSHVECPTKTEPKRDVVRALFNGLSIAGGITGVWGVIRLTFPPQSRRISTSVRRQS